MKNFAKRIGLMTTVILFVDFSIPGVGRLELVFQICLVGAFGAIWWFCQ
jgi:hypothetical protein